MHHVNELWVLMTDRLGDNAQALALANHVSQQSGIQVVKKNIRFVAGMESYRTPAQALLDREKSDSLLPPWPRLVISTGYLCAIIACWIKDQNRGTKIVQLGRPKRPFRFFDLIITTPQFRLPPDANHLQILLPLGDKPPLPETILDQWARHFSSMPRPLCMLAIGGIAKRLKTDRAAFYTLIQEALDHAERQHGSLVIVTSPRTPDFVVDDIHRLLPSAKGSVQFFPFGAALPNPYPALLHLADDIIATNDSASMPADAIQAGKRLYLYEFKPKRIPYGWRRLARGHVSAFLSDRRERRFMLGNPPDRLDRWVEARIKEAAILPKRNPNAFARELYRAGLAKPLGKGRTDQKPYQPYQSELPIAAKRVLTLLASNP